MFRTTLDDALLTGDVDTALRAVVASEPAARDFPELGALAMPDGAGRHKDVLDHSIKVAAKTPARLTVRLAALCHDVGKPATRRFADDGTVTFQNHEEHGARLLRRRLPKLGYRSDEVEQVATTVAMSGRFKDFDVGDGGWTDAAVRRYVRDAGTSLDDLLDLCEVDVTSKHAHKHAAQREQIQALRRRIDEVAAADARAAERPDLDGRAVMERFALEPGPAVGQILASLLEARRAAGRPLSDAEAWTHAEAWVATHLPERAG